MISGLTQPEGTNPVKDLRKPSPFELMIVWSLERWSKDDDEEFSYFFLKDCFRLIPFSMYKDMK
jgi:hypothetical protein